MRGTRIAENPWAAVMAAIAALIIFLAIVPVGILVASSFTDAKEPATLGRLTLDNYIRAWTDPEAPGLFLNTFTYAGGFVVISLTLGTFLAWLVTRTDSPFRNTIAIVTLSSLIFPPFLKDIAWIFLASPKIGFINQVLVQALQLSSPPLNIYSLPGMIFVRSTTGIALVFLLVSASLRSMDPALEEAAYASGSGLWTAMRRVTLPLVRPAIVAAGLLLFVEGIESFDTPLFLGAPAGIYVFTSKIFFALNRTTSPDYAYATALSSIILILTVAGVLVQQRFLKRAQRFVTVTSRFRPGVIPLGKWKYLTGLIVLGYVLIVIGLPLGIVFLASLSPFFLSPSLEMFSLLGFSQYARLFDNPLLVRAFPNTLILASVAPLLTVFIATAAQYIVVKTTLRGRTFLDALGFAPIVVPSTVLAVGMIWFYLRFPIKIYGTLMILFLAYSARFLPTATRLVSGTIYQIHNELEESARACGSSTLGTFRKITLPLLKNGFISSWAYGFIITMREFNASLFLYTFGSEVVTVLIYNYWDSGYSGPTAALTLVLGATSLTVYFIFQKILKVPLAR